MVTCLTDYLSGKYSICNKPFLHVWMTFSPNFTLQYRRRVRVVQCTTYYVTTSLLVCIISPSIWKNKCINPHSSTIKKGNSPRYSRIVFPQLCRTILDVGWVCCMMNCLTKEATMQIPRNTEPKAETTPMQTDFYQSCFYKIYSYSDT